MGNRVNAELHRVMISRGEHFNNLPLIVPESTLLSQIALEANYGPCVLAVDESGEIIGLAMGEEISRRLNYGHPRERERWANATLSTLLATRLVSPPEHPRQTVAAVFESTAIYHRQRLLGMVTEQDVFLSWQYLGPALSAAATDPLTSLANRMTYERRLQEEWNRSQRLKQSIAVILCDIDRFKHINDTCGHPCGDDVIKKIALQLESSLRSYDLVSRYGGDEFICLMIALRPKEILIPLQRIQSKIKELTVSAGNRELKVTASFGAAICHSGFCDYQPRDLIEAADRCLYRAKSEGTGMGYFVEQISADGLEDGWNSSIPRNVLRIVVRSRKKRSLQDN